MSAQVRPGAGASLPHSYFKQQIHEIKAGWRTCPVGGLAPVSTTSRSGGWVSVTERHMGWECLDDRYVRYNIFFAHLAVDIRLIVLIVILVLGVCFS